MKHPYIHPIFVDIMKLECEITSHFCVSRNYMTKPLELPKTLRTPELDEVPRRTSVLEQIKKRETANIVEGYTLNLKDKNPDNVNLAFEFYSQININNSKLWELFISLTDFLPNEAALISGHTDFELNYGNYIDKKQILEFLKDFEKELVEDTYMSFGLIFDTEEIMIEIFIDECKYIKFWGVDKEQFEEKMNNFGLRQIEDLEFVDEYPKVRIPLRLFDNDITDTKELLEILKTEYE